jgi:hypothetical protein
VCVHAATIQRSYSRAHILATVTLQLPGRVVGRGGCLVLLLCVVLRAARVSGLLQRVPVFAVEPNDVSYGSYIHIESAAHAVNVLRSFVHSQPPLFCS